MQNILTALIIIYNFKYLLFKFNSLQMIKTYTNCIVHSGQCIKIKKKNH